MNMITSMHYVMLCVILADDHFIVIFMIIAMVIDFKSSDIIYSILDMWLFSQNIAIAPAIIFDF